MRLSPAVRDSVRIARRHALLALAALVPLAAAAAAEEEGAAPQEGDEGLKIEWVAGPGIGRLGSIATVQIPEGYVFTGPEGTRRLMEAMHNPTDGTEMGFIAPSDHEWFVVFEFDDIGYVKDDDKAALDANAILASLREGQTEGNKVRQERGWATLEIAGWMQPPHYDTRSNNLEWATKLASSAGGENVNYNSRLLGRRGVMSATLVGSEEAVRASMDAFKDILEAHAFESGERYAEFTAGDKVAAYGLTALITGGAAAVALKTGLFQKFWKLLVVAGAGLAAGLRKFFRRSSPAQAGGPTPT